MVRQVGLSDAVDEYLTHCAVRGLSPQTVRGFQSALGQLLTVVGNVNLRRIEGRHVDAVFARYQWAQSTRNNRLSQFHTFFAWCRARGYLARDSDPLYGWRRKTPADVARTRVPRTEWGRLFAACRTPLEGVVVATGLYLFLRASEQQALRVKHVHLDACEIDVYRTKTGQWDRMPIPSELDPYLREHLSWYSSQVAIDGDHHFIPAGTRPKDRTPTGQLIAGTGQLNPYKPISQPHRVVKRVLARCGYPTAGEGEHTLRRSGARAYFDYLVVNGYDGALRRVQSMLGHKNSRMTEIYLGLDLDRHSRNNDLRGKPMFPTIETANVHRLGEVSNG